MSTQAVRLEGIKHIHLLGIGGVGMSGLALLFSAMGYCVTGCDLSDGPYVQKVRDHGTRVLTGHSPTHLTAFSTPVDLVAYSSAVKSDNPELVEARRLGLPVLRRAELLSTLFNAREGIGVAGTHGKTTTTSMISLIMEEAGRNPSVAIGGEVRDLGTNAKLGAGSLMVAELDESDGTFLYFQPRCSVITNIDWDHVDHYDSFDKVLEGFEAFVNAMPRNGCLVACGDDKGVQALCDRLGSGGPKRFLCGLDRENAYRAEEVEFIPGGGMVYTLTEGTRPLGQVRLQLSGEHFLRDSLCAAVTALQFGVDFDTIARALARFSGAKRRLQYKGTVGNVLVYDDYGHHPREIEATMDALAQIASHRPVHMLFQPHRFSRTQAFGEQFAAVLARADRVYLLPIYPAAETPIPGVTSEALAQRVEALGGHVCLVADADQALVALLHQVPDGALLITEGAGDVYKLGESFLNAAEEVGWR